MGETWVIAEHTFVGGIDGSIPLCIAQLVVELLVEVVKLRHFTKNCTST
jgi:hypothetical protein